MKSQEYNMNPIVTNRFLTPTSLVKNELIIHSTQSKRSAVITYQWPLPWLLRRRVRYPFASYVLLQRADDRYKLTIFI